MKMKIRKIAAITAALSMTACCAAVPAQTVKHEQVYVVAGTDGEAVSVTDEIRLENADGKDEITDKTLLSQIESVDSGMTFTQDGDTLTWQAGGKDVAYHGTGDKTPAVLPVVTITLDGEEVSAEELAEMTGEARLTVTCRTESDAPALMLCALPLPEEGVSALSLHNASVITQMGRQILLGWAVPGVDGQLDLPASFSADFHADHASLDWMMTCVTSAPIEAVFDRLITRLGGEDGEADPDAALDEVKALLTAMAAGEPLPETAGMTKDLSEKLSGLNTGLTDLNDGASSLAAGAAQLSEGAGKLKDGASTLNEGLATLTANDETLKAGAHEIFSAILDTANETIAQSGLAEAGIELDTLTEENYEEVLGGAIAKVDPETLRASAYAQVEEQVRPQVEAAADQIRAGVEEAVRAKVLEGVLEAAGLSLTAEEYSQALDAGQVTQEQAAAVDAALEEQMASDEVAAQIEENVNAQIEQMVKENTEDYLASDEDAASQLAMAQTAYDSLSALKGQLDSVKTFVDGIASYTEGAEQAAAGAEALSSGLGELSEGADSLMTGAAGLQTDGTQALMDSILAAEKDAADALLPYVDGDLTELLRTGTDAEGETTGTGYDLCAEDMTAETVYIIRTDLR